MRNPIIFRQVGPDLKTTNRPDLAAAVFQRFAEDMRAADARHAARQDQRPTVEEVSQLWSGWKASRRNEEPQPSWSQVKRAGWKLERNRGFDRHGCIPSGSRRAFSEAVAAWLAG